MKKYMLHIEGFKDFFSKKKKKTYDISGNMVVVNKVPAGLIETQIVNNRDVLAYMCADVKRSVTLTRYLKSELTAIFGHHNKTYKGEFFYYIWYVRFDNNFYSISTARDKGTTLSVFLDKNTDIGDMADTLITFVRKCESILI